MKNIVYILLASLVFASCERDADIPVKKIDPRLAITALIGNDQDLFVDVQLVKSIFDENPESEAVAGATVKVFSDLGEETFVADGFLVGRYRSADPNGPLSTGKSGVTYTVEVRYNNLPVARGTCTVPEAINVDLDYEYFAQRGDQYQDSIRRFKFKWNNPDGKARYYRYGGSIESPAIGEVPLYWSEKNLKVESGKVQVESPYSTADIYVMSGVVHDYLKLYMSLRTMDEQMYRYMRTFDLHQFGQGNPFSEPVVLYTNIEGGLGIVGGYTEMHFEEMVYTR